MSPNFKASATILFTISLLFALSGCTNTMEVLNGATHACGTIHVEGYVTDSQGDIKVIKAPKEWTPEQVDSFCG